MAKIEMDLSEYQEIQKVNRLLEESLEKERQLAEEVDKLKQEKIDILRDAEKVVTIVERIDRVDTIKTLYPHDRILQNIFSIFNRRNSGGGTFDGYTITTTDPVTGRPILEVMVEAFFKTETMELYSQEKSVIRKGFDEVKAEAIAEFDKDIKEGYEIQISAMSNELSRLKEEAKANEGLLTANNTLIDANKRLISDYDFYRGVSSSYAQGLDNIYNQLRNDFTIFNFRKHINIMRKILRDCKSAHQALCEKRQSEKNN